MQKILRAYMYRLINSLFFDANHCKASYESELSGKQHDERFEVLHKHKNNRTFCKRVKNFRYCRVYAQFRKKKCDEHIIF